MQFTEATIAPYLEACDDAALDALDFGVIVMDRGGHVTRYNATESRLAGLSAARVVGKHFFTEVAPCTNNYLVASRFEDCAVLDETLPYVFTLRMRPRNVELRLVKTTSSDRQFLLVRNR
jgi:photoactive yellow protein